MKTLELDLNSFFICEKANHLDQHRPIESTDELVKLNKIDALASYECVQKLSEPISKLLVQNQLQPKFQQQNSSNNNKEEAFTETTTMLIGSTANQNQTMASCCKRNNNNNNRRFFIIDNGNHYRCLIPAKDLTIDHLKWRKNKNNNDTAPITALSTFND